METSGARPILIVDDYGDALDMYQQYLTFKGYRVVVAASGAEAIAAARAWHPSVIFMDLRMPHMSGTEALRVLRRDPALSDVPVVALTAHAFSDEITEALASGFNEVISKPCNPDALIDAVERLLARSRQAH